MADNLIQIIIKAKNLASKELSKTSDELDQLGKDSKKTAIQFDDFAKVLGVTTAAVVAVGIAAKKAFDFTREGAVVQQTTVSFERLTESLGITADVMDQMRDASLNTVDDMTLMSSVLTMVAGASEELQVELVSASPKLLEIAKAANALNPTLGDTSFFFESIATGIKRAQPLILDNLGITLKMGEVYDDYADSLGKTANELDDLERQQALLNAVLEQGDVIIEQVGGSTESAVDAWDRYTASLKNVRAETKRNAAETGIFQKILEEITQTNLDYADALRVRNDALDLGIIEENDYAATNLNRTNFESVLLLEDLVNRVRIRNAEMERGAYLTNKYASAEENAIDQSDAFSESIQEQIDAQIAWREEFDKITDFSENFNDIISLAEKYDDIMGEINDKQERLDDLMGIIEDGGGYLDGAWVSTNAAKDEVQKLTDEIETLSQEMEDMANQVTLDMFQATIAIDGITQAEADAYFQMAADMKLISREAANEAIRVYTDAVNQINGIALSDKSATFTIYQRTVKQTHGGGTTPRTGGSGTTTRPLPNIRRQVKASGGPVAANRPYIVGERGPELFVPTQPGRIEPNHRMAGGAPSGNGSGVTIVYSPQMSFATEEEIRMRFVPLVEKAMRQLQGF